MVVGELRAGVWMNLGQRPEVVGGVGEPDAKGAREGVLLGWATVPLELGEMVTPSWRVAG